MNQAKRIRDGQTGTQNMKEESRMEKTKGDEKYKAIERLVKEDCQGSPRTPAGGKMPSLYLIILLYCIIILLYI